jgi:NAD(P)-dependent dehydrogenase (short-subunit alcohol dehydrogenase family)
MSRIFLGRQFLLTEIAYHGENYDLHKAYGQSKTANILFTVSLAAKLDSKGVTAFSLHPGVIFTNLIRHMSDFDLQAKGILHSPFTSI